MRRSYPAAIDSTREGGAPSIRPSRARRRDPDTTMTPAQRATLVITGLGLFMIFLDALVVNVALPRIQDDFGAGEAGLQWVVAAYSLGMAAFIMTAATLADIHGRRRVYIVAVLGFTAASVVCGLAQSLAVLNLARGVQGVAAAAVTVASLALVSAAFPDPKAKARAIGIWTAIACTGTAIGPTLGGVLVDTLGWRSVFLVNLPVGVAVALASLRFVAESRDERPRTLDPAGQGLFIVAVAVFAYAVIAGPRAGWLSASSLALFAVAAVATIAFVAWERRVADPMMSLALFRDRTYSLAIVTICAVFFAMYGMLLVTTQYLQNVHGYSPAETGLLLIPYSVTFAIVSPLVGRIVAKAGARRPILFGLATLVAGLVALAAGMGTSIAAMLLGLGLTALGAAFCLTPITTLAMASVPPERAGMASGIMSAQRAIGSTVGFAVFGSILAGWLGATLDRDLARVLPDPTERAAVAQAIVRSANPAAHPAELGPRHAIAHPDPRTEAAIVAVADGDFVQGMRIAVALAVALLAALWVAGYFGYPRGERAVTDAEREARKLEAAEP
jgi:EmrB/QacA subfamily drug resistance transporter